MPGIGSVENPYVETWFAGRIVNVHWDHGKPGPTPKRLVIGLQDAEGNNHFAVPLIWTVSESGPETGSATLRGPGQGDVYRVMTLSVIAWSGANIFGASTTQYVTIAPGADWNMTLSGTITLGPQPPGFPVQLAHATYNAVTIDPATGAPNGTLLSLTLECESGGTQTLSLSASGVAPS
jgi:hypothetical protein